MLRVGVSLLVALFLLLAGVSAQVRAADVFLITSANGAYDAAAAGALTAWGHSVTLSTTRWDSFSGAIPVGTDAVVFLPATVWTGDMPTAGQNAIRSFVQGGGGLVTGEWTNWMMAYGQLNTIAPLMPVQLDATYDYSGAVRYDRATPNAVLNNGVASSFTFAADNAGGTESHFAAKSGATVFYSTPSFGGAAGVVGWDYGAGRVISFSTLAGPQELSNSDYRQLFGNAAAYAAGVPVPSTYLGLASLCGTGLLGYVWRRRRGR